MNRRSAYYEKKYFRVLGLGFFSGRVLVRAGTATGAGSTSPGPIQLNCQSRGAPGARPPVVRAAMAWYDEETEDERLVREAAEDVHRRLRVRSAREDDRGRGVRA